MTSNPLLAMALRAGGTGLGTYLGGKLGYGKKAKIDNNSELLGSQFSDLSEYEEGVGKEIVGKAVGAGVLDFADSLKSEYGQKVMDSLRAKKIDPTEQLGGSLGLDAQSDLGRVPASSIEEGMFPSFEQSTGRKNNNPFGMDYRTTTKRPDEVMGVLSQSTPENVLVDPKSLPLSSINKVAQPKMPNASLLGKLNQSAKTNLFSNRGNEIKRGLARSFGIGGDEFATRTTARGLMDNPFLQSEEDDSLYDLYDNTPSVQNALLGLSNTVSQYNMPGMAHGGYVPEKGFGGLIQYRKGY